MSTMKVLQKLKLRKMAAILVSVVNNHCAVERCDLSISEWRYSQLEGNEWQLHGDVNPEGI